MSSKSLKTEFQILKNGQDRLNGHQNHIFDPFWRNLVKIRPEIENLVYGI